MSLTTELVVQRLRSKTVDRTLKILLSLPTQSSVEADESLRPVLEAYFQSLDEIETKYRVKELLQDHESGVVGQIDQVIEGLEEDSNELLSQVVGLVRKLLRS